MENQQLYNIFSENGEVEKSNQSTLDVINYTNAAFYYEIEDNEEEEITSIEDAIKILEVNGQKVVPIYKYGGNMAKEENYQMVSNQNKQIGHHSNELKSVLKGNKNVPAWVVAKVNRSATDLSDATHYLEGEKMALGGNIADYSATQFFNGLNLSAIPKEISDYIISDIQSDRDLELISTNDETFVEVKNLIAEKFPKSLEDSTEEPIAKSEEALKYEKEIADLNELISIEDDSEIIAKYEKEIADLNELIELIS
jgi:hypothetical protein